MVKAPKKGEGVNLALLPSPSSLPEPLKKVFFIEALHFISYRYPRKKRIRLLFLPIIII